LSSPLELNKGKFFGDFKFEERFSLTWFYEELCYEKRI
jgi:hypothetical protein